MIIEWNREEWIEDVKMSGRRGSCLHLVISVLCRSYWQLYSTAARIVSCSVLYNITETVFNVLSIVRGGDMP